jgi:hypothetical protein
MFTESLKTVLNQLHKHHMKVILKLSTTCILQQITSFSPNKMHISFLLTMAQQPTTKPGPPDYREFMTTLRHTTVGRTHLDE